MAFVTKISTMGIRLTTDEFVVRAKQIHNSKYDYSLVNYDNMHKKITIICPFHGKFEQLPQNHFKYGCQKCAREYVGKVNSSNRDRFVKKAKEIHNNKYDYSMVEYKGAYTKIKIFCKECGEFEQTPHDHLCGKGCKFCKSSKGEERIRQFLTKNNFSFEEQKTFNECKYIKKLKFDFYLPIRNILIEYDGEFHFKENEFFGGKEAFKSTKKRDKIKDKFAKKNKIKLIRIPYTKFKQIEQILLDTI